MKQASRSARKAKLKKIYDAADMAERANNSFRMYQVIRSLAPKQTFHKVNIRSDSGELLGPEQAAKCLRDWFSDLYHAEPALAPLQAFDWPFTSSEFQHGLQQLPLAKALDPLYTLEVGSWANLHTP